MRMPNQRNHDPASFVPKMTASFHGPENIQPSHPSIP